MTTRRDHRPDELIRNRWWGIWLGLGIAGLAAGVAMAVFFSTVLLTGADGAAAGLPFVGDDPGVVEVVVAPLVALLLGGCLVLVAEILRRGVMIRGFGSNTAIFRPLGMLVHAAWLLVPLAAWLAIVPFGLSRLTPGRSDDPVFSYVDPGSDVILIIGAYGAIAAAVFGALLGSFVKKAWFLASLRRLGPLDPAAASPFWFGFSYFWRFDTWLVAVGALVAGMTPLPIFFGDGTAATVTLLIGGILMLAGLAACTRYRSSGMPLGVGSSIEGGTPIDRFAAL